MRIRRRHSVAVLSLAVTLAISATVYSQTPEGALLAKADQGDPVARIELAKIYSARDQLQAAIEQLEAAASAGNLTAHVLLADQYAKQPGRDSWAKALHHVQLVGPDDVAVSTRLGVVASLRAIDEALPLVERQAYAHDASSLLAAGSVGGDPNAKWHLGYLNVTGVLVNADPSAGMALILNAADAGHVVAARWASHTFADVAVTGRIPPGLLISAADVRSYAAQQSLHYLEQAAAAGNPIAMTELADRFASGNVPDRQPQPARAQRILSELAIKGAPPVDVAADTLSVQSLLVNVGDPALTVASIDPATAVASNQAPTQDRLLAERDATIARLTQELNQATARIAALESELAEFRKYQAARLNADDLNRRGLEFYALGDYESALPLFRKAAEFDHSGAVSNLAMLYLNGYVVPQDMKQAARLLQRASELGNLVATENMAELYDTGAGFGRDPSRAIVWYRKAEAMGSLKAPDALRRLGAGPAP